jgi:hypothetical protein
MINVIAAKDQIGHITFMDTTKRPYRRFGFSLARVVQTWVMAVVILLAGVTQSGFIPALLNGQFAGVSSAQAGPGSNVILICTGTGIKAVSLGSNGQDIPDVPGQMAGHGFCSLCATHHGAVVNVDAPYVAPVSVPHNVDYAHAVGFAFGHDIPRIRHSRAPPSFI